MLRFGVLCCLLITAISVGVTDAQHVSQLCPRNISFRGVCFGDFSHIMAVGDSGAVYLSRNTDSNRIWHPLPSPCSPAHALNGVAYYDTLRAAVISDAGLIFLTTDAGEHWAASGLGITHQTLRGICHTADGGLVIVGDSGLILRSVDSGISWTRIASSTTYDIRAVSINTSGKGFFVGEHGLVGRTLDFGRSWLQVTDTFHLAGFNRGPINFRAVAVSEGIGAVAAGDSGAIVRTTNGTTWITTTYLPNWTTAADSGFYRPLFRNASFRSVLFCGLPGLTWIVFSDNDLAVVIAGNQISDFESPPFQGDADGGVDNSRLRGHCAAGWRGAPRLEFVYAGSLEQISTASTSGGFWPGRVADFTGTHQYSNFMFASIDSLGDGFATAVGGGLLKTRDNGLSWTILDYTVSHYLTDIYTIDSNNALAVGWAGSCFRTTNGGLFWDSTIIDPNNERLHSIAHPAKDVFIVCGDYGTLLRSTDNGSSWIPRISPTTAFLEAVAFSTPSIGIAVGTNGTILRTTDQGVTWSDVNNILSGGQSSYRQLVAFPNGTYYASTDSSGLFRSTDHGASWLSVNHAPRTIAMGFNNEKIGVIADSAWSSNIANDTMRFAFSRDGFASAPHFFTIPIMSNNRMVFHFLDSNTFLCFGSDGFVIKVDMSQGSARVSNVNFPGTSLQVHPNPCEGDRLMLEYDLPQAGKTTIELWNARGECVQTLFAGEEQAGHRGRELRVSSNIHGALFLKLNSVGESKTVPIFMR